MSEYIHLLPTLYFLCILYFYFIINRSKILMPKSFIYIGIIILYFSWSILLGFRNIYEDPSLDSYIFSEQAKKLSISEIWEIYNPKLDILLVLIMKLYFTLIPDDILVLILTSSTIIGLIFIGISTITHSNFNSSLIVLSTLVFTNTGILLTGNFLRQGFATAIFINLTSIVSFLEKKLNTNKHRKVNPSQIILLIFMSIVLLFSHMSSMYLLICLLISQLFRRENIKKPQFLIFFGFIAFFIIFIGPSFMIHSDTVYSDYKNVDAETEVSKMIIKFSIDAIGIVILVFLKHFWVKAQYSPSEKMIRTCIVLFIICILYFSYPIIALRLEYYLNFLIMLTMAVIISEISLKKILTKVFTLVYLAMIYCYSFIVYQHPTIVKILNF